MHTNAWVTRSWPLRLRSGFFALAALLVCLVVAPMARADWPNAPTVAPVVVGSGVQGTPHTCSYDPADWGTVPADVVFQVEWRSPTAPPYNDFYLPAPPADFSTYYGDPPIGPGNLTCTVVGILPNVVAVYGPTSAGIPYSAAPPALTAPSFKGTVTVAGVAPLGGVGNQMSCIAPAFDGNPTPTIEEYNWWSPHLGDVSQGQFYTPTEADAGQSTYCSVRISNSQGSATAYSDDGPVGTIWISGIPINIQPPRILLPGESEFPDEGCEGDCVNARLKQARLEKRLAKTVAFSQLLKRTARLTQLKTGDTLTCTDGLWDLQGSSITSFEYQWERLIGHTIPGATNNTYVPTESGSYVCMVKATNARGTTSFTVSDPVDISLPASVVSPPPAPKTTTTTSTTSTTSTTPEVAKPDDTVTTPAADAAVAAASTGSSDDSGSGDSPPSDKGSSDAPADAKPKSAATDPDALQPGEKESPYGPTNDDRSTMATHVPTPADLNLTPKKVATGSMLALLLVALLGLPAAVFNETAERHHDVFAGWLAGFTAFSDKLFGWIPRPKTPTGTLGLSVLIGSVIFSFVSPGFPTAPGSWEYFLGMLLGLGLVGTVFFATWRWYIRTFIPEATGEWRIYPLFVGLAAVIVIISRIVHFVPGVIMGTIAEYEPSKHLGRVHEGRRVAFTFGSMLLLALVCWLLWIPVQQQAGKVDAGAGWLILDAALSVGFISGLETTVFGLLPLKFLDGNDLRLWHPWVWVAMWGTGILWFCIVIVDPAVSGYGTHTNSELPILAVTLGTMLAIAATTWLYFVQRHKRNPSQTENH